MANYGYSTPFQGFQQGLPAGYMQAATDPGRNLASGLNQIGDGIAEAIKRYKDKKAESEYTDQKNADMFQMIQSIAQQGNIMDHKTPESELVRSVMGFTGQKDINKLGEYAVNSPGLTLAKKKALAHDLEYALSRYDTNRTKNAELAYKDAVTRQVQQEMAIKEGTIATDTAMAQVPVLSKQMVETYDPNKQVSVYDESGKLQAGPGTNLTDKPAWDVQRKEVTVQMPFSDFYRKYAETAAQNKAPVNYENALKTYQALGGRMPVAEGMVPTGATQSVPGGAIQYQNMDAELAAMDRKFQNDVALANIKNQPELDARTISLPNGGKALAPSATAAKDLREVITSAQSSLQNISELQNFFKQNLGGSLSTDARAKAETIANTLKGNLRLVIIGPGAVSDSERKILDSVVANPTSLFSLTDSNKIKLEELKGIIQRSMSNHLKANGIEASGDPNKIDYSSDPRLRSR